VSKRTIHRATYRGRPVILVLRSGERIRARFIERRNDRVILSNGRRYKIKDILKMICNIDRLHPASR